MGKEKYTFVRALDSREGIESNIYIYICIRNNNSTTVERIELRREQRVYTKCPAVGIGQF